MFDYKLVEALARVLSEGGFERAARALHVTQSAVSQRVRLLEERMGCPLLVRGTPLRPTETGQAVLRHFRQVRLLEADFARSMEEREVEFQSLPLAVNADSLDIWLLDALGPLVRERRILLDLVMDDQERTHELLVQGEVAGCLSTRTQPLRGTRCRRLGVMPYVCCASPEFVEEWFPSGGPDRASARRAPAVLFNRKDELHDAFLSGRTGWTRSELPSYPRHYLPSSIKFVDAVRLGMAYGMIPAPQAAPYLATGELVDVSFGQPLAVEMFWHQWDLESGLMDAVRKALQRAALQVLVEG